MPSNGASTAFAPIQVRISTVETMNQNLSFLGGLNFVGFDFDDGITRRIMIDRARATTPPSFDGMDRRIT